jgi:hypothetical protein
LVAFGLGLAFWAIASRSFVDAEGFPTAERLLPLAAGLGAVLLGTTMRTSVATAAAWGTLLLIGQAAGLRLINAGTALHYQHFRPWSDAWATEPLAATIVILQILLVTSGLARMRGDLLAWTRRVLGWRRGGLLALAFVLSSATLSEDPASYLAELPLATVVQAASLATIVLAAAALPREATGLLAIGLDRALGLDHAAGRPRADRFILFSALAVTVVTALLCVVVYERHPHVQDEVKYLYQSRYYAEGMIAMPAPPAPEAFDLYLLEVGSRGWYSVIPPGWPLVLAVGQRAGAPWLVNPVLSGLNIVLVYLLLWRLYGRRLARLAVLLLSVSPWYLYLGMSFMPHMVTLTCFCVGALGIMHARETGALYPTWISGAAVGFLSLVRQLDGFVVASLLGLWSLGVGGQRLRAGSIVGLVVSTALVAGLTLPYNEYFTGQATTFPIMVHNDRVFGVNSNAYGFGPDRGMGWALDPFPGHGVPDALVNANLNVTSLNVELFGWMTGSLIFVYFVVVTGRVRSDDWPLLALAAAVFIAYVFQFYSGGPDFSARYWFLMIVPAAVLTVRGIRLVAESLAEPAGHAAARVTAAVLALSAVALVTFMPWRALDKYHHFQRMRPDLRRLATEHGFGESLVFVRGPEFPDYASAAIYNPIDLGAPAPVYVRDCGPESRNRLRAAYGERPVWMVDGPSRTGNGYRVAAGPVTWEQLLQDPGLR